MTKTPPANNLQTLIDKALALPLEQRVELLHRLRRIGTGGRSDPGQGSKLRPSDDEPAGPSSAADQLP